VINSAKLERTATMLFKALADPTRLRLLNLLAQKEVCVCDLTGALNVVQPKISRHLGQLKRAGLVHARRDGKWIHYRWADHGDALVRHVLAGLGSSMARDPALSRQRQRLQQVCCSTDGKRRRGKTNR
jgi:ArsR family transcriptional regulator